MKMILKTKDHWAFLDEIEAPMWVDLTLEEAKSDSQDCDDEWFYTSHLFHQFSSRQLKAAFAHAGEESLNPDFGLRGTSPKLPSSVSRSRGKDYRSKNWRRDNHDVSLNKPHPVKLLSGKSSLVGLGSGKKMKPRPSFMKPNSLQVGLGSTEEIKPKLSFVNSKGTSNLKRSLVCERSSISNAQGSSWIPISVCEGSENSSSSTVDKGGESNPGSTVTSESNLLGQQKFLEVSSRAFGHTSDLLSAVRITLRKSCITRQASRVETNSDRKQSTETKDDRRQSKIEINKEGCESRDRKSSSSKSSVGSSSVPGLDSKSSEFISTRKKEKTPDSRHVTRMSEARAIRVDVPNVSKDSTVQFKEGTMNSIRGDKTSVAKSNYKQMTKSKVRTIQTVPGFDGKKSSTLISTTRRKKEKTLGSRHVTRMSKEQAVRVNVPNVSKDSIVRVKEGTMNSIRRDKIIITNSNYKEMAKSKVQSLHAKSSLPLRVNEQKSSSGDMKAREKVELGGLNRMVGSGKENSTVRVSASQKCNDRKNPSGSIRGPTGTKHNVPQKSNTRVLAGPKVKISDRSEGMNERVYIR
ncbi:micronuclear linker histone polyprotein-like isoform X1 [Mangifera indica]|uniref:micronuclear linker histone polyprotein-like isoform X1 n=1 Tax=Mangifera indica TaxID=29780 RepID=UPI001CFAE87F|nr:micronuclear linker histone polyprotein-like isoform X1 [Mangifera indica]